MKKLTVIILAAMLLCACGEKTPEYSEPEEDISLDATIDYSDVAHELLEKDDISLDDLSEIESVDDEESAFVESQEESEVVSQDESDSTSQEESEESDTVTPVVKERVLVVTADIAYADGTSASLVCTADGDVDLYFGNGVAFNDMEAHPDCLDSAKTLISLGGTYYDRGSVITEFPYPETGATYIYIKTESAVYRIEYDNTSKLDGYMSEFERAVSSAVLAITLKAEQ